MSGNGKADAWPSGLVIVDKPGGMTSHDVVARLRRVAHTRRVGHAGTLDPMATGVLVIGIEKATRLLGHLTLTEKTYEATIRLGQSTSTDDAEGEPTGGSPATEATRDALAEEIAKLTGEILQVPSSVSAIKVNGQRAYKLTRAGEAPELAARPVTIYEFLVTAIRQEGDFLDLDATVRSSSGTYIRALARDLGTALGVGGHLTALRRTAVGPYTIAQAHTLKELEDQTHNQSPERLRLTPTPHPPPHPPEAAVVSPSHPAQPTPTPHAPPRPLEAAVVSPSDPAQPTPDPRPDPQARPVIPPVTRLVPPPVIALAEAAAAAFPRVDLTEDEARRLAQGARLPMRGTRPAGSPPAPSRLPGSSLPSGSSIEANGTDEPSEGQPIAALAPDGTLVALVTQDRGQIRPLAVFADPNLTSP